MKNLFGQPMAQFLAGILAILLFITATAVIKDMGHARALEEMNARLAQIDVRLASEETSIANLDAVITALVDGNEVLEKQLAEERLRRAQVEEVAVENQTILKQELSALQTQVQEDSRDYTGLINRWDDRVAKMHCSFFENGTEAEANGSAVATTESNFLFFITNKHVVYWNDMYKAKECTITLPSGKKFSVETDQISISEKLDIASIRVSPLTTAGVSFTALPTCATAPSVGDELVILGYPSVGSKDSITATEGIISGFDGEYYVTSAKIERGNSGGAAIHVRNDCFLGIPTLVYVGRVESLARILPL